MNVDKATVNGARTQALYPFFKTSLCNNPDCQYVLRCNFAHGEFELRKPNETLDPTLYPFFKTAMCRNFPSGDCEFGDQCHFAHRTDELRTLEDTLLPSSTYATRFDTNSFKTRMCKNYKNSGVCKFADRCSFAHGQDELKEVTVMCKNYATGTCKYGRKCQFAHGYDDMRCAAQPTLGSYLSRMESDLHAVPSDPDTLSQADSDPASSTDRASSLKPREKYETNSVCKFAFRSGITPQLDEVYRGVSAQEAAVRVQTSVVGPPQHAQVVSRPDATACYLVDLTNDMADDAADSDMTPAGVTIRKGNAGNHDSSLARSKVLREPISIWENSSQEILQENSERSTPVSMWDVNQVLGLFRRCNFPTGGIVPNNIDGAALLTLCADDDAEEMFTAPAPHGLGFNTLLFRGRFKSEMAMLSFGCPSSVSV